MRILRPAVIVLTVLALLASSCALAEGTYYGSVVCERTQTILAPFGGVLTGLSLRKGDLVRAGDQICTIETSFVCSPVAGTVSAVFGAGGDSVEEVKNRCGGVVYIIPENRFSIAATDKDAARNPDCYISVGQTVWLQMGRRNAPVTGTGIVTSVSTEAENLGNYTVEISSGVFSPDDNVAIYRREDPDPSALLGFGTVQQTPPVVITGEGSILRVHVKPGSTVSRGTVLFETVTGSIEMKNGDNRIFVKDDGIVASVETGNGASIDQNSTLITMYPLEAMRVCISVPETSLPLFTEGKTVNLTFGTGDEQEGTIQSIDYLAETDESVSSGVGYANYKVYIDFELKDGIRQGMLVTVDLP